MKKILKVQIGYYEFLFPNITLAQDFADAAAQNREKDTTVRLTVEYEEEEEDEV